MKKKAEQSSRIAKISVFLHEKVLLSAAIWLSVAVFGFLSYTVFLQRQGFPSVDVPISIVQGTYFANDKNVVDAQLAKPIVEQIQKVDGVKKTTATVLDNQATIVVEYEENVPAKDGSQRVENAVKASVKLPAAAQVSYEAIDAARFNNKYDILLAVSSSDKNIEQLEVVANNVAEQLKDKLPDAKLIEPVSPFKMGTNPQTGQQDKIQTSADWSGERHGDSVKVSQSIIIGIQTSNDEDVLAFDDSLNSAIQEVTNKPQFKDVSIINAAGFADSIRLQIASLQGNLVEGLLIVIVVCLLYIGLRAGLLAALGMLVTLSVTSGALYLGGLSLNTITLFGLVLCLGLIVDDTIIMIEAIDAQRKQKKALREAIAIAAKKVALASAAGTFTTILGFAPLLFIGGILGEFIRVLPVTIIISLLTSLLVSLFFIPFASRWFLNGQIKTSKRNPLNVLRHGIQKIGDLIAGYIMSANTRRKKITHTLVVVGISLIFIFGTGPVFGHLKFDIFPSAKDGDAVQIEYTFAPGTTLQQAEGITGQANTKIKSELGDNLEKITYAGSINARQASASITLTSYEKRDVTAGALVSRLESGLSSLPGTKVVVSQVSAGPPKDRYPFRVQIPSDNPEQANAVAAKLAKFLNDRTIKRQNGTTARVEEVQFTGEKVAITRTDGQRIVEVSAAFDADDTSALVQAAESDVKKNFLSDSSNLNGIAKDKIMFDFGNESNNQESFKSVLIAMPLLVLAMYLLLALQFKSLMQPLLILIAVPFSFFGVAVALLLTNNPFSFFVMVAFFALIGISVNNTILLTDYANQGRRAGLSPRQAMAAAVQERIRPLLTTSTTSILALTPLALTDPFWESLAVTLIGGLAASTILVVMSFPYYYLTVEAVRSRLSQRRRNKKASKRK